MINTNSANMIRTMAQAPQAENKQAVAFGFGNIGGGGQASAFGAFAALGAFGTFGSQSSGGGALMMLFGGQRQSQQGLMGFFFMGVTKNIVGDFDNGPRPPKDPKPEHDCKCEHDEQTPWKVDEKKREIDLGDGYKLSFENKNMAWTLTDADGKKTRVWGDPHVDEDADGKTDWDFYKNSSFVLDNGTKITVDTKPWGNNGATVSDRLTVTRGDQSVVVSGIGDNNVKFSPVMQNGQALDDATPDGEVFFEGGDGVNNWYSSDWQKIKSNRAK